MLKGAMIAGSGKARAGTPAPRAAVADTRPRPQMEVGTTKESPCALGCAARHRAEVALVVG